jgi:hypothetical protein
MPVLTRLQAKKNGIIVDANGIEKACMKKQLYNKKTSRHTTYTTEREINDLNLIIDKLVSNTAYCSSMNDIDERSNYQVNVSCKIMTNVRCMLMLLLHHDANTCKQILNGKPAFYTKLIPIAYNTACKIIYQHKNNLTSLNITDYKLLRHYIEICKQIKKEALKFLDKMDVKYVKNKNAIIDDTITVVDE